MPTLSSVSIPGAIVHLVAYAGCFLCSCSQNFDRKYSGAAFPIEKFAIFDVDLYDFGGSFTNPRGCCFFSNIVNFKSMVTKDNFRNMLIASGFEKSLDNDCYTRCFSTCSVCVDFRRERIIYPEKEGLVVNDKTTSNFSHNENFVVLDSVCRLLEKGYRPEHIELEPKWQLGRDAKSGKADILVKDENGDALIIIECKTAGVEYNKELRNTEEYGGQLFSYWQQENATRWLALYTTDWKDNEIIVKSHVISCIDDANILKMAEKDRNILVYCNARNEEERFKVWSETYNKVWLGNIIFDEDSQAYNIGIPPLRKNKLRDFAPEDRIVNRFEEILRHNNVSDKENAFNRLIALFVCKLVDEIKKQDFEEVEFQYKQGTDTYETLQDRLQRLHTQGMEEFMHEKIFYVAADYAERLFLQYTGQRRKQAIEDLNNTIRILKFYSNNDFAFKDVHNEDLFYQNGKVLVEVVQLFQPYRIVYPCKHQFLGDLFEQLLNKGFKQNEGQFFTPTPVTRFIWDCLPIQSYISEHGLPNVIDYACGAGHFLTEAIEAINSVRKNNDNSWVEKHIYGIEKDYRLARVSKISLFMNGAGGANVVFGDGLENYKDKGIENGAFDILVANPPYSVSGFKSHLKLHNNTFRICDFITNEGKEIETLFVERIAQLLRPRGIAAVILPVSILSNTSNSYIAARENLLKHFYVRGIVCFGSKTFGATGTNTVVLFLEKFNEPPCIAKLTEDGVDAIMEGDNVSNFTDRQILADYLKMQKICDDTYRRFLHRSLTWEELSSDIYLKVYVEAFSHMSIYIPKKCSKNEVERIRLSRFYDFAIDVERDKLFYFTLVREQHTQVISSPTDNKEQKSFLGYDWSNRKGAEGIVINDAGGKLYNPDDRFAKGTLASSIHNSFLEATTQLPDEVMKYANNYCLKDLLDFSRAVFDKAIRSSVEDNGELKSKYEQVELGSVVNITRGVTYSKDEQTQDESPNIVLTADNISADGFFTVTKKVFLKTNKSLVEEKRLKKGDCFMCFSSGSLKHVGKICYIAEDTNFYAGGFMGILRPTTDRALAKYVAYLMNMPQVRQRIVGTNNGSNIKNLSNKIGFTLIPLPPVDVQKRIISECEAIDKEYNRSRMDIETYHKRIDDIFSELEVVNKSKRGG